MNDTPNPTDAEPKATARPAVRSHAAALGLAFAALAMLAAAAGWMPWGPNSSAYAEQDHALIGQPAPDFTATTLEGDAFSPADARAQGQAVVLDFWASWCPPCVRALPVLRDAVAEVNDAHEGNPVRFVAMNVQEDPDTIRSFLENQGLTDLEVGLDPQGAAGAAYLVRGIPQSVVIDPTGTVTAVHVGFSPDLGDVLKADLEKALQAGE